MAITGWGAVTPLGGDLPSSWRALIEGREAARPLQLFDTEGCRCRMAAEVPTHSLASDVPRRWSRASRLAFPAAREALTQSNRLDRQGRLLDARLTLSLSTTGGGMELGEAFVLNFGPGRGRKGQLARAARYQPQQVVADLQSALGGSGPATILGNACASGAQAIGHGYDLVRSGQTDWVLAGGVEALSELIFVGFDGLQAASTDLCRPFDLHRSGLLLGEGAGFCVLESESRARERGISILGFVEGYGHSTDLHHLTQPDPSGRALVEAMMRSLGTTGWTPSQIGYVNAHGTATPMNDSAEALAYQAFFGESLPAVRLSSTKAAIGHTLGAAGAIESLFTLMALHTGHLPPQLNCREPIPAVADSLVRLGERWPDQRGRALALNVNLGFGGANAALLFSHE